MQMNDLILTEVHIADMHFGAFDPKDQFNILYNEFFVKISPLRYDLLSINGDIFDHKFMANSDAISYALRFIDMLIEDAMSKNAEVILLYGTESHDAGQYNLFSSYEERYYERVHIVQDIRFLYIKGKKILCIPEKYGLDSRIYESFLYEQGLYDGVVMHGTYKGSVYGANTPSIESSHAPVFGPHHFIYCRGPIIAGHVHVPGCYDGHVYYCGSPLRYRFGEEEEKGFIILNHNVTTGQYYLYFEPIVSYKYDTVNMDEYIGRDPKELIEKINYIQSQGSNFLRLEFTKTDENLFDIITAYYRNNKKISFLKPDDRIEKIVQAQVQQSDKYNDYQYIFDKSLTSEQILTRYINQQKGYQYITVDELRQVLNGFMP